MKFMKMISAIVFLLSFQFASAADLNCNSKVDASGNVTRLFTFKSKAGFLSPSAYVMQLGYYHAATGSEIWRRQFEGLKLVKDNQYTQISGYRASVSGRFDLDINFSINRTSRQARAVVSGVGANHIYDLTCESWPNTLN